MGVHGQEATQGRGGRQDMQRKGGLRTGIILVIRSRMNTQKTTRGARTCSSVLLSSTGRETSATASNLQLIIPRTCSPRGSPLRSSQVGTQFSTALHAANSPHNGVLGSSTLSGTLDPESSIHTSPLERAVHGM